MLDFLHAPAEEIGDAACCAGACAHGSAECGQASDTRLLVDADQVGHGKRAKHLLARDVERAGVHHDGDRCRDALVAAARHDNDRHGASAHARVAAGCCCGLCLREQVVGVGVGCVELADAPAPVVFEPLARDGVVVFRLAAEHLFHVGQVDGVGEFDDVGNVEELGQRVFPITWVFGARVLENLAVAFDENHVRVILRHDDARRPAVAAEHAHVDVERFARVGELDSDLVFFQVAGHVGAPVVIEAGEHVEPLVGVARGDAGRDRGFHAVLSARVRNGDAMDVLDDVSADRDGDALGLAAEHLCRLRRRKGDGDRLRAACRDDELVFENLHVRFVGSFVHDGCFLLAARLCGLVLGARMRG